MSNSRRPWMARLAVGLALLCLIAGMAPAQAGTRPPAPPKPGASGRSPGVRLRRCPPAPSR